MTKTIAYAGYQEKLDTTEGFDIRLVAGIYSLNYEKVGFELTLIDDGNMYLPNDYSDTKVYKQINAIGEENDVVTAESCNNANYLTAITIEGCPNPADGSFCIIVKPFTTTDDVKSYGTTIVLRVDNGALLSYAI